MNSAFPLVQILISITAGRQYSTSLSMLLFIFHGQWIWMQKHSTTFSRLWYILCGPWVFPHEPQTRLLIETPENNCNIYTQATVFVSEIFYDIRNLNLNRGRIQHVFWPKSTELFTIITLKQILLQIYSFRWFQAYLWNLVSESCHPLNRFLALRSI